MTTDPRAVVIDYTNWRGVRAERTIVPDKLVFGHNAFHGEMRMFAVVHIHAWRPVTNG